MNIPCQISILFSFLVFTVTLVSCGESDNSPSDTDNKQFNLSSVNVEYEFIKSSNPDEHDNFGSIVMISDNGNTLVVSAPNEESNATGINGNQSDNSVFEAGAVYTFERIDNQWKQTSYIKADKVEGISNFGFALALSGDGNTLAIVEIGIAPSIYIFTKDVENSTWTQSSIIEGGSIPSIALSDNGNVLVVGTGTYSRNSLNNVGAAYVYIRNDNEWIQQDMVLASDPDEGDQFGAVVAISGDGTTIAITAPEEDSNATLLGGNELDNSSENSGAVYVFTIDDGNWVQQAYVKASNTNAGDEFGGGGFYGPSLALSDNGDRLAVLTAKERNASSGIKDDKNDYSNLLDGAVYVYARKSGVWNFEAYLKEYATPQLAISEVGYSVAMTDDGKTILAGAPIPMTYEFSAGKWETGKLYGSSISVPIFSFSHAVSGDGSVFAGGNPVDFTDAIGISSNEENTHSGNAINSGAVYVFYPKY